MTDALHVVILAAGEGKRMNSAKPKVLLPVAGRPMLAHVIDAARALGAEAIHIVYGHRGEAVRAAFADDADLRWVEQAQQLGTGHAVQQAMPGIPDGARVLVLYGDVPLIEAETLKRVLAQRGALAVLGAELADPTGYGRLVLDAARTRGGDRRASRRQRGRARDPHHQHRHRRRERASAARLAVAAAHRQRAGRVLPHRHLRHGRGGGRSARAWRWSMIRSRPKARTMRCSWPRSSAPGSGARRAG